jgi:septum formation protein
VLHQKLQSYHLILGSASPRRQQLLSELGLLFTVKTADIAEQAPDNLNGHDTAIHIAKEKAAALREGLTVEHILITADTEVWQQNKRFGKPNTLNEAREMLVQLAGTQHHVISGVCFTTPARQHCFAVATEVTIRTLTNAEIEFYLKNGHPLDKAGAYGIQEWIGLIGIERINGSYTNVVGMPMTETYTELEKFIDSL